jgi:SAM-dependent methyltransferase
MDRRDRILELIDVGAEVGLELGPLHAPIVRRGDGTIYYVDYASTEELRRHYRDDQNVTEIVDVDIVLEDHDLSEAVGWLAPVDYVVASHVIEHVADPIGWLEDIGRVLRPGGIVTLAIPDKRYCFDVKRSPTELSDLVDAHLTGRHHPTIAQIFDFRARAAFSLTTAGLWAGDRTHLTLPDDERAALGACREALAENCAVEIHCSVFTDVSFIDLIGRLFLLDLLPSYEVAAFHPTAPGSVEFFVSLRRLRDGIPADERMQRQRMTVPLVPIAPSAGELSALETRMVLAKRQVMSALRRLLSPRIALGPRRSRPIL